MKPEIVSMLVVLVFAVGCVCGFVARSAMDPSSPPPAPQATQGYSTQATGAVGQPTHSSGLAPAIRITSPNRATARSYAIEFIRRALKERETTDVAFANMRLTADGENAWQVDGTYRPDAGVFDFSLRVWAVLHEGQWYWSCRDLVVGGKKFPDEINFEDNTSK